MTTANNFKTKDQWLATILYATGQVLIGSEWSGKICWFSFQNSRKCEEIVNDFYAGKVILDARVVINGLKTIKNILYQKN